MLSYVWFFSTSWTAAPQNFLSFTISWSLLKSCPLTWQCYLIILSSVTPFCSCLQSFSASGSYPLSQFFTSSGQSIETSASILPMNIQDWFPLGLTGWISLLSKGLSRVFSSTTIQKHHSLVLSLHIYLYRALLVANLVKNPPAMQETLLWLLGQKDPMEKG